MKKLKLFTILALSLFGLKNATAQSCETGKDPFSGESATIFNYHQHDIYYEKKSGEVKLELDLDYSGELNVKVPAGEQIQIKFDNDEILKLTTVNDAMPKTQVSGLTIITTYTYMFKLDQATIETLSKNRAVLIRYPNTKGGYIDYVVKGALGAKYVKNLQKGANCMLSSN